MLTTDVEAAVDWHSAIDNNLVALKRILALIVAMATVGGTAARLSHGDSVPRRQTDESACPPRSLPRHRHRLVLRLLRAAETAARRLIIVAAAGIAVDIPSPRQRKPKPLSIFVRNGVGTGIVRLGSLRDEAPFPGRPAPRPLALPLLDPFKRWSAKRYPKRSEMPRISFFDSFDRPRAAVPKPLSADDLIDASRLHRRLDALVTALDDLPRQAGRMARWRARRDARLAKERGEVEPANLPACGGNMGPFPAQDGVRQVELRPAPDRAAPPSRRRTQRLSPMRPGRPPGWRRQPDHEVYDVLDRLHSYAVEATSLPDTS